MRRWLLSMFLLGGGLPWSSAAEFEPPVRLEADGAPIWVESRGYAAPYWADIDGDGKPDLLVGQSNRRRIRVFRNLGEGRLAAGEWLKVDGELTEGGVWSDDNSIPQVVDLDGDGRCDVFLGCYPRNAKVALHEIHFLAGQADGSFRKTKISNSFLTQMGADDLFENTVIWPFAADWDGDGHIDLVVGNNHGTLYLFKGLGTGKFPHRPEQLMAGDQPLRFAGSRCTPFVIDWDGDGDLDLLSGSRLGGVQWAENRAGKGKSPRLAPSQFLIPHGETPDYFKVFRDSDLKGPLSHTQVWAGDINSDGKNDVVVGDYVRLVYPAGNLSDDEFEQRYAAWREAIRAASESAHGAKGRTKEEEQLAERRYFELASEPAKFLREVHTGFVWLYLQK